MFDYNRELFSSMNINDKHIFIKNFINNLAKTLNNSGLIDPGKSPNENLIYQIYSDGTITRQKGSWAYGKRTIFEIRSNCLGDNTYFNFPIPSIKEGDTYAIMSIEDCEKLRDIMDELLLKV